MLPTLTLWIEYSIHLVFCVLNLGLNKLKSEIEGQWLAFYDWLQKSHKDRKKLAFSFL